MPIVDKLAQQETSCSCGRPAGYVHCPACGSTNVEARIKPRSPDEQQAVSDAKLANITMRLWSCRRCPARFTDADRAHCDAPEKGFTIAVQRARAHAEQAVATLNPDAQRAALRIVLLRLGGIDAVNAKRLAEGKQSLTEEEFLNGVTS